MATFQEVDDELCADALLLSTQPSSSLNNLVEEHVVEPAEEYVVEPAEEHVVEPAEEHVDELAAGPKKPYSRRSTRLMLKRLVTMS
jgi:hypothetical protein